MTLPISTKYLSLALKDGHWTGTETLRHHPVGNLALSTGQLVACDPFVNPDAEPFDMALPCGSFPVILSVAEIHSDQRVAFASIRFKKTIPARWEMMASAKHDPAALKTGHMIGYGVDAATGCFMDRSTGQTITQKNDSEDFAQEMSVEMEKTYRHTWSWLNMNLGNGNLIAFSSGFGDGLYATYAGFDAQGDLTVVVTDFMVVDSEKIDTGMGFRKILHSLRLWLREGLRRKE
jgi:hypothetical protein